MSEICVFYYLFVIIFLHILNKMTTFAPRKQTLQRQYVFTFDLMAE